MNPAPEPERRGIERARDGDQRAAEALLDNDRYCVCGHLGSEHVGGLGRCIHSGCDVCKKFRPGGVNSTSNAR